VLLLGLVSACTRAADHPVTSAPTTVATPPALSGGAGPSPGSTVSPSAAPVSPGQPKPPAAPGWQPPPANGVFDYQIGGAYPPAAAVRIVDRDRNDPAVPGRYNICYVNAFQTQAGESGWWKANHADLLLRGSGGGYVEDRGWPGELLLDLSTAPKRAAVTSIVDGWFAGCAAKGFQAVEPDNLDSWTRSKGLLTKAHAVAYARLLTAAAHARRLAIAQKNTTELGLAARTDIGFDFAIAESCATYDECDDYMAVYGNAVFEVEYSTNDYQRACQNHGSRISVILRDHDVAPAGHVGYHYEHC